MEPFVEALREERRRLTGLLKELQNGRLFTGDNVITTTDTIRHVQKQIRELGTLIATYDADKV